MSFTAAMAAHLLGLGRRLKIALWVWFGVTMLGTIYLGWHYVVDNIAGVILGTIALILAGLITGIDPRAYRQRTAVATPGRGWPGPGARRPPGRGVGHAVGTRQPATARKRSKRCSSRSGSGWSCGRRGLAIASP